MHNSYILRLKYVVSLTLKVKLFLYCLGCLRKDQLPNVETVLRQITEIAIFGASHDLKNLSIFMIF